jgi:DNA-binding NtrC family response regulator
MGSEIPQTVAALVIIELGANAQCRLRLEFIPKDEPSAVLTAGIFERLLKNITSSTTLDPSVSDTDTFWASDECLSNGEVVFVAKSMTELLRTIGKVSSTNVSILITGETGTGKEIVAKIIHERSRQSNKPFIAFNCAAVPKDLIESQLFGHRRGAFSGANESFLGVIRSADGGTLLLDEIGELPLDIQPKLLRFLDSGEVHPLGEARPIHVDVRLLFATNVDLENAVKQGRFREDLFFRVNVIPLRIPPLRDRREEIPFLTNLFAHRFSRELSKETPKFAAEAMESLVLYPWPGNIRQLSNEIRRLIATIEDGAVVTPDILSSYIAKVKSNRRSSDRDLDSITLKLDQALGDAVGTLERTMVDHALKLSRGQMTEAARILGLSRKGLYLKRQRLGLLEREESSATVLHS